MDVGIVRALGSPDGRAILRSLPAYDERAVMRLQDRLRREGHDPDFVAALLTQLAQQFVIDELVRMDLRTILTGGVAPIRVQVAPPSVVRINPKCAPPALPKLLRPAASWLPRSASGSVIGSGPWSG